MALLISTIRTGDTYIQSNEKLPPDVREYFVKMGKLGVKLGGIARAAKVKEQRVN